MASNESSSVPARLKDLRDSVKERFLGLLGIRQPKVLLEDEQEVFLQVGRTVWHAPRQLRIELWLSSLARRHSLVSEYQTYLSQDITREAAVDIEKDVQRTFPNTRRFHSEEGQTHLRNVLRAYAAYDPEVAYCQGMNFLTGLLLMYMPSEAHAFAALVVLMEDRKLRSFYHRSMSLLQVQLWQLSRLISPALNQHMEALGVVPMLYGASWLMTAFSADFPIPFSARIMDVLLADQCECALLKVATAIMKAVEPRLQAMNDLEDVLGHLKIEVPGWDEADLHDLLTAAFTKPWTSRQLAILRSTEGAETVAQAMDRVMTMNEQLSVQGADDDDGGDDGEVADARVAVTIPRLQPPPQPHSSFSASPACGTPVNGSIHGTGSVGGAVGSPPLAAAAAIAKCSSLAGNGSSGGGAGGGGGGSSGGGAGHGSGGLLMLQGPASSGGSPAVWGIPCIHPNVPASPAIQAFRRAHLPVFQAAVAAGAATGLGRNVQASHGQLQHCRASGNGDIAPDADRELHGGGDAEGAYPGAGAAAGPEDCCGEGGPGTEWGEFSSAVVRQKWRNIIMRAAPGSTRHVLLHPPDEPTREDSLPWQGSAAGAAGSGTHGGAAAAQHPGLGASQPIPVPGALAACRSGSFGSGSAASGKPPLPPRTSLERPTPVLGSFSRLSVVAEDPIAVQVGPVAPAPSPRGSMDMHVLGRGGSHQLEGCEHQGAMLFGGNNSLCAAGLGALVGSASCNGDCASGTASATTAGAILSPSGASGALSPHPVSSPRVHASGWGASAGGGGAGGGGTGSDTPTLGYVPIGMDRAGSGSLFDVGPGGGGGGIGEGALFFDRSFSMVRHSCPRPTAAAAGQAETPLLPPTDGGGGGRPTAAAGQAEARAATDAAPPPTDMATDIAGDILRMLSAVDTCNANAAYDPRAVLGESMYADSPNKEEHKLVRRGSENIRHLPSSSALAELAAQDLARAQEEAERVRLELEAQLAQQRAAERAAGSQPSAGGAAPATCTGPGADATVSAGGSAPEAGACGAGTGAGEAHGSAESGAEDGAAARFLANGDAAAEAATASAVASGANGGGGDELVFKRPTLYVDGIPMFDPKSLMSDSHEAQVMFTPTVSPGASSYADPLLPSFTPTGDTATAVDNDGPDAATAAAAAADGSDGNGSGSDDYTATQTEEGACAADDGDENAAAAPDSAAEYDADCDVSRDAAAPAGATAPVDAIAGGGGAAPAASLEGAKPPPPSRGGLPHVQSASEWVDWSQAPPIQALQPVVIAVSEATDVCLTAGASVAASAPAAVPAHPHPASASTSDPGAAAVDPSQPQLLTPAPTNPEVQQAHHGAAGGALAERDLIDMVSPARPLQPCTGALRDGLSLPATMTTGTGTGLSPVPLLPQHHQLPAAAPRSLPEMSQVSSSSGTGMLPYGLLPADSNLSLLPPPMAPCISFASTATTASLYGGSFTDKDGLRVALSGYHPQSESSSGTPCSGAVTSDPSGHGWDNLPAACAAATPAAMAAGPGTAGGAGAVTVAAPAKPDDLGGQQPREPHQALQSSTNGRQLWPDPADSLAPAPGCRSSSPAASAGALSPVSGSGSMGSATVGAAAGAAAAAAATVGSPLCAAAASHTVTAGLRTEAEPRPGQEEEEELPAATAASATAGGENVASGGIGGLQLPGLLGAGLDAEGAVVAGHGRGGASTPPTTIEHQGSYEVPGELVEVESSPYQAALSPSLASHIMSAYLRSEQHQQQQEQREMEERMQHELQQQQQQQHEYLLASSGAAAAATEAAAVAGLLLPEMPQVSAAAAAGAAVVSSLGVDHTAAGSSTGAGIVSGNDVMQSHPLAPHTAPAAPHMGMEPELSLCMTMPTMASGLGSPALGSPSRAAAAVSAVGAVGSMLLGHGAAAAACSQAAKALTPFAVSLDDPSGCRISAEVLLAMPSQLILQPPETPTPAFPLAASGSGLAAAAECRTVHTSTRGSRRCTGSGDCDVSLSASGLGAVGVSGGGLGGLPGSSSLHIPCMSRPSGGGGAVLAAAAHDGVVLGHSMHLSGVSSATPPPAPSAGAGVTSHPSLQPHLAVACSSRGFSSSSGGAVPPLLPPPPPPLVPLCQTAAAAAAVATRLESASAPAAPPSAAASAPPQPLPHVLCSSSATLLCVNNAAAAAATVPASTPMAGAATAAAPPAAAPSWTATFDVVDDSPTGAAHCGAEDAASRPRALSSAFAAEATDSSPGVALRDCAGTSSRGPSATGVCTPEARLHNSGLARGMSIETTQLPPPPPAAAGSRSQLHWESPQGHGPL